jgi:hypothetical protein
MATKKVTTKSATKKAATKSKTVKTVSKKVKTAVKKSKKATAIAKVKALKHKRVLMEPVGTESLPDMVRIVSGPSWVSELVGRRYVSIDYAITQIEALDAEKVIAKGAKSVANDMVAAGVTPLETAEIEAE